MAEGAVTVFVAEALFVKTDCEVVKLSMTLVTRADCTGAARRSTVASKSRENFFMGGKCSRGGVSFRTGIDSGRKLIFTLKVN
jgi:hypothetical protein